ncbi:PREDICTED: RING finger and CHY zinc finger domain-containing protein 1-like [Acropora digitifera]|uniref:RING finger and CHY zinc finger domain-containing protein 1-like n=1 Tax=Acropora digitifera TaxID=70779 RepID=UPI00077A6DFA|nr:PREDICTED: RING finger and CHY zinc finger domain-containing protein 1-like [Acropora digitifera]
MGANSRGGISLATLLKESMIASARVGGKDNFFHCNRCDMCLQLRDSHKCVEKSSRTDCPICYEDIHTSRIPSHVPPCGHLLHSTCFSKYLETGGYACPICNRSIVDTTRAWRMLDNEISMTPMPEEYNNFYVKILCRDCHKESRVRFHVVGLKCMECGSYNTSREGEEGVPVAAVPLPQAAHAPQDEEEWETEDEEDFYLWVIIEHEKKICDKGLRKDLSKSGRSMSLLRELRIDDREAASYAHVHKFKE